MQLLESQKELDIMREQCFAAETAKAAAMQQQKAAGLLHSKPASPNKESLLFAEVQHLHQQVCLAAL